ncbi:glutamyl-tRNA reductase [Rothia sp. CCM 9417]|uniref:glutamyl-tRNA reductase n=1 Tax=unclassified Rothia (in: high G+C Gram-positive bacteria) TaxID=2689056 RepID=UPI003AD2FC35
MTIFSLVASHRSVDLTTVAFLSEGVEKIQRNLEKTGVRGEVILSTCNRLELYAEIPSKPGATEQNISNDVITVAERIFELIARGSGLSYDIVENSFDILVNADAAHHLFTVASGLESAVVGEREITGQVRRALTLAQDKGRATGNLVRLFDHGAQTARKVGQRTLLGSRGRSIVSVALDMADEVAEKSWQDRRVLVFGTGAYAGATVAALHSRGTSDIWIYSRSHRAATFADKRGVFAVPHGQLHEQMRKADIIIGCSGGASPMLPIEIPEGKRVILDLALTRDFAPEVADLPQVELITLESVRLAAPEETVESVNTARTIVDEEAAEFSVKEKARSVDAAIVALRQHTMSVLDAEVAKVHNQYGCTAATEQLELAMRRMVKSLLHTPTVRARELARDGRTDEYVAALEALYGIEVQENSADEVSPQTDAS